MGAAVIGAMVVGTALQAAGQQGAGEANKSIADMNARFMQQAASDALARGAASASPVLMRGTQTGAAAKAGAAGAGIDVQSGSVTDVVSGTAGMSALDAATIRNNARREAYGYETKALSDTMQGQEAAAAGSLGAAGTILSGTGSATSAAYRTFPSFGK